MDHVVIHVDDWDACNNFYRHVLGAEVIEKWGVPPTSIPDWLGLVGDSSDGFPGLPGWGAKSAAAVLTRYGHYEEIPPKASAWEVPGVGGSRAIALAATLRDHWDEALLYRDLARVRTVEDGVPIRQRDPDELRWDGAPRAAWGSRCAAPCRSLSGSKRGARSRAVAPSDSSRTCGPTPRASRTTRSPRCASTSRRGTAPGWKSSLRPPGSSKGSATPRTRDATRASS